MGDDSEPHPLDADGVVAFCPRCGQTRATDDGRAARNEHYSDEGRWLCDPVEQVVTGRDRTPTPIHDDGVVRQENDVDDDDHGIECVCDECQDRNSVPVHVCPTSGYCDTCDELGLNTHGGMW